MKLHSLILLLFSWTRLKEPHFYYSHNRKEKVHFLLTTIVESDSSYISNWKTKIYMTIQLTNPALF